VGFRDVDDDDALVNVDLGGGESDAGGSVHGFGHVLDQLADAGIHRLHRLGDGMQALIGVVQDIEFGHKNFTNERDGRTL
jgi:hypothetical protein